MLYSRARGSRKQICRGHALNQNNNEIDIERARNASSMRADDVLPIIGAFLSKYHRKKCDMILAFPFCCIIAGKNQSGEATLISGAREKNGFVAKEGADGFVSIFGRHNECLQPNIC